MAYQDRLTFRICIVLLICTLFGCSKQYDNIISFANPPSVSFDKQELKIRVNDNYNTNNNNGFVTVTPVNGSDKIAYTKIVDTTGLFTVILHGINVINLPIDLSSSQKLFVSGTDTGKYVLDFQTYDRFGKYTTTPLLINVVSVIPPTAIIQLTTINTTVKIDASKSYSMNGKIISYSYYIDGVVNTIYNNSYTKTLNPGVHEIGLIVTDDLGTQSLYVSQIVNF